MRDGSHKDAEGLIRDISAIEVALGIREDGPVVFYVADRLASCHLGCVGRITCKRLLENGSVIYIHSECFIFPGVQTIQLESHLESVGADIADSKCLTGNGIACRAIRLPTYGVTSEDAEQRGWRGDSILGDRDI